MSKGFRVQTWNVVCLHCRKAGNSLPCAHPQIRIHYDRVPARNASRRKWQKFVDHLNLKYWFHHYEHIGHGQFKEVPGTARGGKLIVLP
jgi:hypothetical protein